MNLHSWVCFKNFSYSGHMVFKKIFEKIKQIFNDSCKSPLEGWHGPSFTINLMIKFPSKYNIHIALALWNKTIIPWCFSFFLFFLFFEVVDFNDKIWKWQINTWYIARQISAMISLVHPFLQHSATVSVPHPNLLLWYLYLWWVY